MYQYLIKTVISAVVLVAASEMSKRFPLIGALLISLPLVSILALIWLWLDTGDKEAVAALSINVFWLVIPSLVLFISLPVLLKKLPLACLWQYLPDSRSELTISLFSS